MIGLSGWVAMDIQIVVLKSLYPYGDFMMTKKICGTPQVRGGDTELSKANCTFHQNKAYQGWWCPQAIGSPGKKDKLQLRQEKIKKLGSRVQKTSMNYAGLQSRHKATGWQ